MVAFSWGTSATGTQTALSPDSALKTPANSAPFRIRRATCDFAVIGARKLVAIAKSRCRHCYARPQRASVAAGVAPVRQRPMPRVQYDDRGRNRLAQILQRPANLAGVVQVNFATQARLQFIFIHSV